MNASVILVNLPATAPHLRNMLRSLRFQTHAAFEVIVVNGPRTENVQPGLFPGVRVVDCPDDNPARAKNIGAAAAAGDFVAFISNAIPHSRWLEELAAGYQSARLAGVGGMVYAADGVQIEHRYSVCDRRGNIRSDIRPPLWGYLTAGSEEFVRLSPANASFRRDCLGAVGGFAEEMQDDLHVAEVCMRLIDRGYWLRPLEGALVCQATGPRRGPLSDQISAFHAAKSRYYFALQNARSEDAIREALRDCQRFADDLLEARRGQQAARSTADSLSGQLETEVDRGVRAGIDAGLRDAPVRVAFQPAPAERFARFPTIQPRPVQRTFCFVVPRTVENRRNAPVVLPSAASALAASGHVVHVIAPSQAGSSLEFDGEMWIHRLQRADDEADAPPGAAADLRRPLGYANAVHEEVLRIGATVPVDVIAAPLGNLEALYCLFDDNLRSVLTVDRLSDALTPARPSSKTERAQRASLEQEMLRAAGHIIAPTDALVDHLCKSYGVPASRISRIGGGIPDRALGYRSRKPDGRVLVLFSGSLARRSGGDLVLEAAATLTREDLQVEFHLIPDDGDAPGVVAFYESAFEERYGREPFSRRVIFHQSSRERNYDRYYPGCDIVCLPGASLAARRSAVDAAMFGKPIVAIDSARLADIVQDGVNAFSIEPSDFQSLAAALRRLIVDAPLRQKMALASRDIFDKVLSTDAVVQQTLRVYQDIIEPATADQWLVPDESIRIPVEGTP